MSSHAFVHSEWRTLASGAGFTEGPIAHGDEVVFVSINRGEVSIAALDGSGSRRLAETGGGPNGAAIDAAGRIWIAQNGGRVMTSRSFAAPASIQSIEDGLVTTFAQDAYDAPNDCAFGPDDRLYFTDPHGRLSEPRPPGTTGAIRALDTGTGEVETIAIGLPHPNGLCFSADGSLLWISDTRTRQVSAYQRATNGTWSVTMRHTLPWGAPDGLAIDVDGRLWVAATDADGIAVLHPSGVWTLIELGPSFPTNICFAGPDLSKVVVTAARGGRVLAADAAIPGVPLLAPHLGAQIISS